MALLLLGVAVRFISPAIFLDIASLWPIGAVFLAGGWVVKTIWSAKPIANAPLVPLLIFSWLVFSASFYFAHLPGLPSSSADLRGPPADLTSFDTMAVEMSQGRLILSEAAGRSAYQVDMIRRGGGAGIPVALESTGEDGGRIRVIDARESLPSDLEDSVNDNAWLRFAGWEVRLHPQPTWMLTLTAPEVSADLRNMQIVALEVNGEGDIKVGEAPGPAKITINGSFTLEVPEQIPVEVIGAAIVPEDWTVEDNEAWFGERGAGWQILVSEGGSAQIVTADQ